MRDNVNMQAWPDRRLLDLLKLKIPIIQAPMAGSDSVALARTVSSTGALGSLACPLLSPDQVREAVRALRQGMTRPFNLNFFCHTMEAPDAAAIQKWKSFLGPHYDRLGIDIESVGESRLRLPFNDDMCTVVEEIRPEVVSFHFGLPNPDLVERLKRQGIKILSSATSVREAKWLVSRGCDAIIAQGFEAGGHRGMFLETNIATQLGLFALLPQVRDAVSVPVIAAGGIADARGIVAALALGASGVQLGTAYLFCPEANVSPLYRRALEQAADKGTALSNLFSGRPPEAFSTGIFRNQDRCPTRLLLSPTQQRSLHPCVPLPSGRVRWTTCSCGLVRRQDLQSQCQRISSLGSLQQTYLGSCTRDQARDALRMPTTSRRLAVLLRIVE